MTLCYYCNDINTVIDNETSLCNKCNLVYIQNKIPYDIDDLKNYYDDKYEEYKNKN